MKTQKRRQNRRQKTLKWGGGPFSRITGKKIKIHPEDGIVNHEDIKLEIDGDGDGDVENNLYNKDSKNKSGSIIIDENTKYNKPTLVKPGDKEPNIPLPKNSEGFSSLVPESKFGGKSQRRKTSRKSRKQRKSRKSKKQ